MKYILFPLLSLISICCSAQSLWTEWTDTTYHVNGMIASAGAFNEIDSTWTLFYYHQNGKLSSVQPLASDGYSRQGQSVNYNPDGTLGYLISHKENDLFGPFIQFHSNGNIKISGAFYNGFKSGTWTEYSEKGDVVSEKTYGLSKADSSSNPPGTDPRIVELVVEWALMPMKWRKEQTHGDTLSMKDIYMVLDPSIK